VDDLPGLPFEKNRLSKLSSADTTGLPRTILIFLKPFPSRFWSPKKYAKVIEILTKKYKLKAILNGSLDEKKFSEEIKRLSKNKKDIIIVNGVIGFNELAVLVSKSRLVIAPGTSIIHLASAYETPVVELMGKESPEEWHPWMSKRNYKIIFHPEVCTECDKTYCRKKTTECMKAISPGEVIRAADKLLN